MTGIAAWRNLLSARGLALGERTREELLRGCSIGFLYLAIFSGRFSFNRFVDELSRAEWLELRLWLTALAFTGWLLLRRGTGTTLRNPGPAVLAWSVLLGCFYLYLFSNLLVLGDPALTPGFIVDALVIGIQVFLAFQLIDSLAGLIWLARAALATGVMLFVFCLLGYGNPELNGRAWAPFGGPITFYRIEFLAFCAALFLYAVSASRAAWINLAWAVPCLFSTLASLSKGAYVASVIVIALFVFWTASIGRWRWAFNVFVVSAFTYAAFALLPGSALVARVQELGNIAAPAAGARMTWNVRECPRSGECPRALSTSQGPGWNVRDCPRALSTSQGQHPGFCFKDAAGNVLSPDQLSEAEQRQLRGLLLAAGYREEGQSLSVALEIASRVLMMFDGSGRSLMAAHAWHLFRSHPWFGVGLGNYDFGLINPYTHKVWISHYPHNIFLEVAVTGGFVGLALFSVLVFTALVLWQRRVLASGSVAFLMGFAIFVLLTALFSGDLFDFRLFWLTSALVFAPKPASSPAPS